MAKPISPYQHIFDALARLEKIESLLLSQLPQHVFAHVFDDKPGVAGYRCKCGLWSSQWSGEPCDGTEIPLPDGYSYERKVF